MPQPAAAFFYPQFVSNPLILPQKKSQFGPIPSNTVL
jgi:hypothetical protein